jgi:ribonuclease VapC
VIVVDASAIVAILTGEPERDALTDALERASEITTSPLAIYEATLGLVRILRRSV